VQGPQFPSTEIKKEEGKGRREKKNKEKEKKKITFIKHV
jgi:hypothetical protein